MGLPTLWVGMVVQKEGVGPDPSRIRALQEWPPPRTKGQLREFFGSINWVRPFLGMAFAGAGHGLRKLLKKDVPDEFGELDASQRESFEKLKRLGELTYKAFDRLPQALSTKPKRYDPDLKAQVDMLRLTEDFYTVYGLFRLAGIVQQIYKRFKEGNARNPAFAQFGPFACYLEQRCLGIIAQSSL